MKRFITLFVFAFIVQSIVFAAAPTVPASNLTFSGVDGARFTGTFKVGNGNNRIIVVKEGSPVTGLPVNGVDYTANSDFGSAASAFTEAGEFVVGKTSWNSFTVSKLKPGTTYYVAVFEYNGTGAGTSYLMLSLTGSQATVVAPTTQASAFTSTSATGNTFTLGWTKGNGDGRIIIARKGAPVDVTPVDLTNYYASENFGTGTKIGTNNYVVYKDNGSTATVKNLEPNVTYYFAVFEYNGSVSPVFLSPGASTSAITNAGPNVAPTGISFSYVEGNGFRVSVTVGNGTRRLFIAKKGSPVTAVPVNGLTYTANAVFGTPAAEIAPGEFVVSASTNGHADLSNLEPNTTYHFRVYEYDVDAAGNTYYLTSTYAVKSGSTVTTPTAIASNFTLNSLSGSSVTIGLKPGNGLYRMVIMKAGSPVDAVPANLVKYTSNSNFGSGSEITPGNWCVIATMNGSAFTVNSLEAGITYHLAVYEYNGSNNPVYSATGATFQFTVPLEPTVPAKSPLIQLQEGKSLRFVWTKGNGARRMVVARKGSAVLAKPVDQVAYAANENFGQGEEMAPGEFVMYNGTEHYFDLRNLEVSTTYHLAVYEYNVGADGKPDYLTSSFLAATVSTVTWPTAQPVLSSVSGIQANQATVNFTKGDGAYRLFIMKKGSPVNVLPQDLVKYSYSSAFGSPGSLISDGNYVVNIPSGTGNFGVSGLEPNTTYYLSGFEFNGYQEPAYLRTAPATISFTTTDVPGATTPTNPATNLLTEHIDGNKFTLKWSNGNGEKRLVLMKAGSAVTFVPAAGTAYTSNAAFGNGTDLGEGQYCVYNGAGYTVDITNLQPSTTYYIAVYEFNGTGTMIRYLTSAVLSGSASTLTAPATPVNTVQATPGTGSLSLTWNNGSGHGRLVVMKEGSAVAATPASLSVYPANATFKNGSQIAAGEYVVFAGNGNAVTVTGLQANKTYHYSIFEYNGTTAPVYNTAAIVSGSATLSSTLPISLLYFKARQINGDVLLTWATAQEVNNASFTIERSITGGPFEAIKTMAGAGNSHHTIEYSYSDANAPAGTILYRLKQTDLDGRFTYSPVVTVKPVAKGVHLYPNPVQGQFRAEWPGTAKQGVLLVYDAKGVPVKQQKVMTGQLVNGADLKPGSYYLVIQAGGEQYRATMIKQ